MTISSTTSRWEFTGDGSTTAFAVNNKFFADSDLVVTVDGTTKTLTTDYTVSGAGEDAGGTVTFVSAPASATEIVILRDVPNTQTTDLPAAGAFPAASVEDALDKSAVILQQFDEVLDRALRYKSTDQNIPNTELPTLSALKGKFLKFNSTTGAPEAGTADPTSVQSLVSTEAELDSAIAAGSTGIDVYTSFTITSKKTPPAGCKIRFLNNSIITKAFNGDMFELANSSVEFLNAKLAGDGANFTGRGIVVSGGNTQRVINTNITDMASYCVEFDADGVGSRFYANGGLWTRNGSGDVIKMPVDTAGNGTRYFEGIFTGGDVIVDLNGGRECHFINCNHGGVNFSASTSTNCVFVANRWASTNQSMQGSLHRIIGCSSSDDFTLAANADDFILVGNRFATLTLAAGTTDHIIVGNNFNTLTDNSTGNHLILDAALGLLPGAGQELTIATGAVVPTHGFHTVDTESDAASDDLDTITATNARAGDIITIIAANSARSVVAKDGTGNLKLGADRTLDNVEDTLTLRYDGTNWLEIAFANNGA